MNLTDQFENAYFEWMYNLVCDKRYSKDVSYRKLLMLLHSREFTYILRMDENRASDGICLRRRFALSQKDESIEDYILGPCSVLEMMVALAVRCEESIMDDPEIGDRTGQWFWEMIVSLGLGSMSDGRFDKDYVNEKIDIFLNREYEPNGAGGLFTLRKPYSDVRNVEIWAQAMWHLDEILGY